MQPQNPTFSGNDGSYPIILFNKDGNDHTMTLHTHDGGMTWIWPKLSAVDVSWVNLYMLAPKVHFQLPYNQNCWSSFDTSSVSHSRWCHYAWRKDIVVRSSKLVLRSYYSATNELTIVVIARTWKSSLLAYIVVQIVFLCHKLDQLITHYECQDRGSWLDRIWYLRTW